MISENVPKISSKLCQNIKIQGPIQAYLFIKTKLFLLHPIGFFMGFNLIYWTPYGRFLHFDWFYFGKFWKNGRFSGRIWPDWGNAARGDLAGLGSIGLNSYEQL